MRINMDEKIKSVEKKVTNKNLLKHQGQLISQGICPDTLQPMKKKYFVSEDFVIYFSPFAGRLYYTKPVFSKILKVAFGGLIKDLKYWLIGLVFEGYTKINKKYPEKYIKEVSDNIEVIK
jgi:hypothetical protein